VTSGKQVRALPQPEEIHALALSQDDRLLLAGCRDGAAHLWEVSTGRRLASLQHQGDVLAVAFSPDGRLALTGSADRTARVWDVVTGTPLGPPCWHQSGATAVAFSHQGHLFATGSADHTAQVWQAPAAPLEGRLEAIKAWAELLAGVELEASGTERPLGPEERQQRQQVLARPDNADFAARIAGQ
jgi:eukaryotic-like serine/threonine-protein kinase